MYHILTASIAAVQTIPMVGCVPFPCQLGQPAGVTDKSKMLIRLASYLRHWLWDSTRGCCRFCLRDIHLHTNEEAGRAIHVCHWRQCQHVPERLAALLIVQQPHCGFSPCLDGLANGLYCLWVRVCTLKKPAMTAQGGVHQDSSRKTHCCTDFKLRDATGKP